MSITTTLLADVSAEVFRRVHGFAADQDVRYYLNGVHLVPGRTKQQAVRMEGTNGHLLYCEEDKSAVVQAELIVSIGKRGRTLLRGSNRIKVYSDKAVHITDQSGAVLYIEPCNGVIDGKFPVIDHLVGVPADWHEGLVAPVNTGYLMQALSIPGYVRFFSRRDKEGAPDMKSSVMFIMDGGTANGGKAFGLIMPTRGQFAPDSGVDAMLPDSLVQPRAAA
ncbi:hypothetical protein ISP17_13560 [Dyella ginsengisoli]|uniref:Uncharacterized protein n=1 Tax=Dyella ginsengisoli TaxID=363848 RepID=A0ABW8JV03_9GAMM